MKSSARQPTSKFLHKRIPTDIQVIFVPDFKVGRELDPVEILGLQESLKFVMFLRGVIFGSQNFQRYLRDHRDYPQREDAF